MKKTIILSLMTAVFLCGCQKENPQEGENQGSGNGKTATVYIDGETVNPPIDVRSTDGTVYFEGGYATGAGIYDGTVKPTVAAHPDAGYEVDFFYGGPESEPKKYDYSTSGKTNFLVDLAGSDHYFKCGFKEKKRTLTVNAGTGGTATGGGTYQCDKPIPIKASPKSGYTFAGWEVNTGDVTIADKSNANTTATLNSLNSTITAKFRISSPLFYVILTDEQFETRGMLNAAYLRYWIDENEISTVEKNDNMVKYSIYEQDDIAIVPNGNNTLNGWYNSDRQLISDREVLYRQDIEMNNIPKGGTIYACVNVKSQIPSSVSVQITSSGTGYDMLYGNEFPSTWPKYDKAEVVQYKLISSWGEAGTLKLYYSLDKSTYCTITGANSYYPLSWYRGEDRSSATFVHWEWTVGSETTVGYCTSIYDVKGELTYNGIKYSISCSK